MRYSSFLEVDFSQLEKNVRSLSLKAEGKSILAMVKADAYGHGSIPITHFLFNELKIKDFGVATLGEGIDLRKNLSLIGAQIFVFSDLEFESSFNQFVEWNLIPVISDLDSLKIYFSHNIQRYLPLVLKFNTGMNRLGLNLSMVDEVIRLCKNYNQREIFHVMSHLSDSYMQDSSQVKKQQVVFGEIISSLKTACTIQHTSIGNSAYIEQEMFQDESYVRPGLALYGGDPVYPFSRCSKLVSSFYFKIIAVRTLREGDLLGYGNTMLSQDSQVAIANFGYGDGFSTLIQGTDLLIDGDPVKIIAKVNMDLTFLLFPKNKKIKAGDVFSLWSRHDDNFYRLFHQSQGSPYTLTTQISSRILRKYVTN